MCEQDKYCLYSTQREREPQQAQLCIFVFLFHVLRQQNYIRVRRQITIFPHFHLSRIRLD